MLSLWFYLQYYIHMIIDPSVPLNEATPVYPGDPSTKIEPAGDIERDGYCDHYISIGTHVGTHIDAPIHMIKGGKSLDQIPLDQLIGKGKYIEITDGKFDVIKNAQIEEGDIVVLGTGMSKKYYNPTYFEEYPVMSEEIAEYLVSKKVKMVGMDTGNPDNQDSFPIHKILLGGGILIAENLTNTEQLNGKDFTIYALPLNLQIDGSPARIIAEIK